MKTHRENRTLAEKQYDVKSWLLIQADKHSKHWLSTNEIARGVGMARNGRFKKMLDWMVECGSLQVRECERSGRWPGYEYSISETIKRFYNRPLKINRHSKGQRIESLELFS